MKYESFTFSDHLGLTIFVHKWLPEESQNVKGLVCILHGMAEHGLRYAVLAERLTKEGFVCYAEDHRGHGKTMEEGKEGWQYDDGMLGVLKDISQLLEIMKKEWPDKPVFLLGHSWGSFMATALMEQQGEQFSGVILCGSNGKKSMLNILLLVAKLVVVFKGKNTPAKFAYKASIEPLQKPFHPAKSPNVWLSSLEETVKKYDDDPLCGFRPPNGYFLDLAKLLKDIWKRKNEAKIPKTLPIFITSGAEDPVSNRCKTLFPLIHRYQKLGLNVQYKFYTGVRHEVLNDVSRDEFIEDVVKFLQENIQ